MKFARKKYPDETLKQLYEALLFPRMIEEKMLILLRQNRISKWFSGIGQEAIAVGIIFCPCTETWACSQDVSFRSRDCLRNGKAL
jgi:TPP-dependent pyruvate/acetoin dehydrogenase alpha subunit